MEFRFSVVVAVMLWTFGLNVTKASPATYSSSADAKRRAREARIKQPNNAMRGGFMGMGVAGETGADGRGV